MDLETLGALRALVDQHRIRILARAAARPVDVDTLAVELRQPVPAVRRHLEVLLAAGLVERREPGELFAARPDRIGALGKALAQLQASASGASSPPGGEWPHEGESLDQTLARLRLTPEEAKVLRSYLVDGRLETIPAQPRKRDVILRFLLERVFTQDRTYPEKEVNQRLALFHPDVAALRRYLVDEHYVDREAGLYRRRGPRPEA